MIWPQLLEKCEINFAYQSFKWSNSAKKNAGVTVNIIGLNSFVDKKEKKLYFNDSFKKVSEISPYLVEGKNEVIYSSRHNINSNFPEASLGCLPLDGGNFILTVNERELLVHDYPEVQNILKKYIGSKEFINDKLRYVLWLNEYNYEQYLKIPFIKERLCKVRHFRESGGVSAKGAADTYYEFFTKKLREKSLKEHHEKLKSQMLTIIIPRVSSENRVYIPMGIVGEDTIVSDSATAIYDAPIWLLGLLESRMHMVWLRSVGGKLKTDYRYSAGLVYNTFPVPLLSRRRKNEIEDMVYNILDIRNEEGGTLAELYGSPLAKKNPKPMNLRLKEEHQKLDKIVDRAYKATDFKDDNERLSLLLDMYSDMLNK